MPHHHEVRAEDAFDPLMWLASLSELPLPLLLFSLLMPIAVIVFTCRAGPLPPSAAPAAGTPPEPEPASAAMQALLSHEIRTPLAAISRLLELALANPADKTAMIQTAWQASTALLALLDDLISQSKAQQPAWPLCPAPCQLEALFDELQQIYQPIAASRGLRLTFSKQLAVPRVILDAQRLRQILHNLLSNALKYTAHGAISVQASSQPDGSQGCLLQICVRDSGIGMSAQLCAELDQPYQAAGAAARQRHGGHGLGLHLSRQLLRQMGGEMRVQSLPERGTLIRLTLPVPVDNTAGPVRSPAEGTWLAGYRVLLVEDEVANRVLLMHTLQQWGIAVTPCTSGMEALRQWLRQPFHLLLIDRQLPDLSGPTVCRVIRQLERRRGCGPTQTILGMTTGSERCHTGHLFDAWLEKPVAAEDLLRHLQEGLQPIEPGEILNLSVLGKLIRGDRSFGEQFLAAARQSLQSDLQRLRRDQAGQREQLAQTLHHLQGLTRLICTPAYMAPVQQLMQSIEAGQDADIQRQLPELIRTLCRVSQALAQCPPQQGWAATTPADRNPA
ncbi:ATP-binding protein [Paludibacterium sp. B53371]|uniref:ATP-binding protein n=1 Tax=Paludibacterium sp. B53371 TaxID=2806263 RepID=UPI001C056D28|nr:ATP-binding protein [Paludibacterium sp. B53371]